MLSVLLTTRRILTEALRARTPTRSPKDTSPQLEKRVLGQGRAPLRVWRAGGLSGARARTGEWDASRERRKSPAGRSVNSFCVRGVANLHVLGGGQTPQEAVWCCLLPGKRSGKAAFLVFLEGAGQKRRVLCSP